MDFEDDLKSRFDRVANSGGTSARDSGSGRDSMARYFDTTKLGSGGFT
jgi:hypothetical protein